MGTNPLVRKKYIFLELMPGLEAVPPKVQDKEPKMRIEPQVIVE